MLFHLEGTMIRFFYVFCVVVFSWCHLAWANNYEDLVQRRLIQKGDKPYLHLGCGESYIVGAINIDLPIENRPLHLQNRPDYFYNILDLQFPLNSVAKIENHHMFEHFSRPVSIALLCAWTLWMDLDGELVIETPDFENAIKKYIKTPFFQNRQVIIRHLFGSHEANWAYHYDGWYYDKFAYVLSKLGFQLTGAEYFSWKDLDNITIKAKKTRSYSVQQLKEIAYEILKLSCVDSSESEYKMWKGWCADFDGAIAKMIE